MMEWLAQQDTWFSWFIFWILATLQLVFYVTLILVAYDYWTDWFQKHAYRKSRRIAEKLWKKYSQRPDGTYFDGPYTIEVWQNHVNIRNTDLKKGHKDD